MVEVKDSSLVIEAAGGASGKKTFSVDPPGRELMYGNMPIIPENGYAQGDDSEFISTKTWKFDAGTPLAVEYVNEDATNTKIAYVTITYEVNE